MSITTPTRRGATIIAALLGIGLMAAPAAAADAPEETMDFAADGAVCQLDQSERWLHFGHYRGHTVTPSATQVTSSGLEAQCILGFWSQHVGEIPHPGTYDGIFGPNSQASMRALQAWLNEHIDAGLAEDGLPGPQSWPYLRGDV